MSLEISLLNVCSGIMPTTINIRTSNNTLIELDEFTVEDENRDSETLGFLGPMIERNCDGKMIAQIVRTYYSVTNSIALIIWQL